MSESDETQNLRLAIDRVSRPIKHAEIIRADSDRSVTALFRRTDEPLLEQLRAAISNGMETGGGPGRAARERTPIAIAAFTLYETIDGRVRSWMLDVGGKAGRDLTVGQILQAWFVLWMVKNPDVLTVARHAAIVEGWEQQILDTLDPPKRIEITSACPLCNKEWVNVGLKLPGGLDDPNDLERVRVLVAVERANIEESYATCRHCERVWTGVGQMRALRILLDDKEAERHAVSG